MSSESDDDFQSADEGSDLDEFSPASSLKPALHKQEQHEDVQSSKSEDDHQDKEIPTGRHTSKQVSPVLDETENVTSVEDGSLIKTLKNLSLQVTEQLIVHEDIANISDSASDDRESDDEGSSESPELKFKPFSVGSDDHVNSPSTECIKEEALKTQVEEQEDTSHGNLDETNSLHIHSEVRGEDSRIIKGSEETGDRKPNESVSEAGLVQKSNFAKEEKISENKKPNESVSEGGLVQKSNFAKEEKISENKSLDIEEKPPETKSSVAKEAIPAPVVDEHKVLESKLSKDCDFKDHDTQGLEEKKTEDLQAKSKKSKPIRESKIGMKKPREKLGERLGARKLGAKLDKKPLESISSESHSKSEKHALGSEKAISVSHPDRIEKELVSEERHVGERDESSWQQEEKRWQQVHNIDGKQNMRNQDDSVDSWGTPWGNWGTTLISAASTFTQEVGRGVGNIMDTVEGSLGVPDPETMAKEVAEYEKELKASAKEHVQNSESKAQISADADSLSSEDGRVADRSVDSGRSKTDYGLGGFSSFGSLVSGVSGVFETASNKVLMGGLDTLEVIGRKAMDVIQDGDPGLRKKRAFISNPKPNLSVALQEARQRAAEEEQRQQAGGSCRKDSHSSQVNFDQAWDTSEGCVHMEALSLVGKQCETKMASLLQNLPHYAIERIQASNTEIRNACELDEECTLEENFITRVEEIIPLTYLPVQSSKVTNAWKSIEESIALIKDVGCVDGPVIEQDLYATLVDLVAQFAAVIHKGAELALITPEADPLNVAVQFKELSSAVCGGIENVADEVCGIITNETSAADPKINNTITNIYLQSASGSNYVKECMTYLALVLQYANTKQMAVEL